MEKIAKEIVEKAKGILSFKLLQFMQLHIHREN